MRFRVVAAAIALSAVTAPPHHIVGHASGVRFRPPFRDAGAIGSEQISASCGSQRHRSALRPDAAAGRISSGESITTAASCAAAARSLSFRWSIGSLPRGLAGRPGDVIVVVEVLRAEGASSGNAARAGARVGLGVGRSDWGWDLSVVLVDCRETICRTNTRTSGQRVRLQKHFDALPGTLEMLMTAQSEVTSGAAQVSAAFEGILQEVIVVPAG